MIQWCRLLPFPELLNNLCVALRVYVHMYVGIICITMSSEMMKLLKHKRLVKYPGNLPVWQKIRMVKNVFLYLKSLANMTMKTKARPILTQYHQCLETTYYEQWCCSAPLCGLFMWKITPTSHLRKSYSFPLCFILKEARPLKTSSEFNAKALYLKFLVGISIYSWMSF